LDNVGEGDGDKHIVTDDDGGGFNIL